MYLLNKRPESSSYFSALMIDKSFVHSPTVDPERFTSPKSWWTQRDRKKDTFKRIFPLKCLDRLRESVKTHYSSLILCCVVYFFVRRHVKALKLLQEVSVVSVFSLTLRLECISHVCAQMRVGHKKLV